MTKAMHEEHRRGLVALADCVTALQAESRELERDPRNATAVRDYNFGIAQNSGNKLWMNTFGRPGDRRSAADPEIQRPLVLSRASCHLLNGTRFRFNLSLPFRKSFDQIEQDWN